MIGNNLDTPALRFNNFAVPYLVDETLREGVERCFFPISTEAKLSLLKAMTNAGLRAFIVGCGPEAPEVWKGLFDYKRQNQIPNDVEATFIILLNCWETAYNHFSSDKYKTDNIKDTVFSFGMITYKESEKTFERAINAFKSLGAGKFKASILNNFRGELNDDKYNEICRQIDIALDLGVTVIRINDSVGLLQPHVTHNLCARLVSKYPDTTFCLHAHNDTGLAVANAMASIQAGFQMIEGSLAGFGNRSGIAPTEQVVNLCKTNQIALGSHDIDIKQLCKVARYAEKVFMQAPNVFRPVGGALETDSNYGVLNIPDFLEIKKKKNYFVNYSGLHAVTIKMAMKRHHSGIDIDDADVEKIIQSLKKKMNGELNDIKNNYKSVYERLFDVYRRHAWTSQKLADEVVNLIQTPTENAS